MGACGASCAGAGGDLNRERSCAGGRADRRGTVGSQAVVDCYFSADRGGCEDFAINSGYPAGRFH